jgi:tRNA threonylcarbamoyladenosine biosynthesis protein TsaE
MKFNINNLKDTKSLSEQVAKFAETGDVIELIGDLGAGKTTFAKYFINSLLEEEEEVLSPTFNLVHPYYTNNFTISHFDLYRLKNLNEAEEIGIYDAFDDGVCLIEWPEIISSIVPKNRLLVKIFQTEVDRFVIFEAYGNWQDKINKLQKNMDN